MTESIKLVTPQIIPPLDYEFRPASLASRTLQNECSERSVPLVIGLERGDAKLSRFESQVFPEDHPRAQENFYFAERLLKFLLWQRGGSKVYIGGPRSIVNHLQVGYSPNGKRNFDYHFMSEQVYEQPFIVEICDPSEVPPANDTGRALGRHFDGCRIGFDLGASDRKGRAVIDGRVVFSEEVIWEPRNQSDPA